MSNIFEIFNLIFMGNNYALHLFVVFIGNILGKINW